MRIGDGDIMEPRRLGGEGTESRRADQQADQEEADHRADPETGEGWNDDPGRAQDYEGVAEAAGLERGGRHPAFMPLLERLSAIGWRNPLAGAIQATAIAFSRLVRIASKNCSVVIQLWSGPIRMARSLVIWPCSTVATQTRSSVSANAVTSGVSSVRPRCLRPPVQAKIEAIGLVDVALDR